MLDSFSIFSHFSSVSKISGQSLLQKISNALEWSLQLFSANMQQNKLYLLQNPINVEQNASTLAVDSDKSRKSSQTIDMNDVLYYSSIITQKQKQQQKLSIKVPIKHRRSIKNRKITKNSFSHLSLKKKTASSLNEKLRLNTRKRIHRNQANQSIKNGKTLQKQIKLNQITTALISFGLQQQQISKRRQMILARKCKQEDMITDKKKCKLNLTGELKKILA